MESLLEQVKVLLGNEAHVSSFLLLALIMTAGSLVVGFIGRFAFGKKSILSQSVSSGIGILFIYAATIVMYSCGVNLKFLAFPLPFVNFSEEMLYLPSLMTGGYVGLCGHLLNMVILSFLVNIINRWLPQGKKLFGWFFFRILSVILGMLLFSLANYLLTSFLPEGFIVWAHHAFGWCIKGTCGCSNGNSQSSDCLFVHLLLCQYGWQDAHPGHADNCASDRFGIRHQPTGHCCRPDQHSRFGWLYSPSDPAVGTLVRPR